MKKLVLILSIFISVILYAQETRNALIIGNSNYETSYLKNPVNDANLMAKTLKEVGFNVTIFTDVKTQNDMKKIVRDFGKSLEKSKGTGLFYYAGHGIQIKGVNYLVPISAKIDNEEYVEYECLDVNEVFTAMSIAQSSVNIVILDACRNNPFAKSFRSMDRGLAVINKSPSGTIIAFATAPGSVASDGAGENGLYTEELVKNLKKPGIKIEDVFKETRIQVSKKTNNEQIPWENSSLMGDFYFINQKNNNNTKEAEQKKMPKLEEEIIYGSAKIDVKTGGKLYLDGEYLGDVTLEKKTTLKDITAGKHIFYVLYEDYKETQEVNITGNSETVIDFTYKKQQKIDSEINFVLIEGGKIEIGEKDNEDNPLRWISIDSFLMSKFEITQKEWIDIMGNNPSDFRGDSLPVEQVSWLQCIEFCNKKSIKEGLTPCYTIKHDEIECNFNANGYRLPTENEWEYAARGGNKSNKTKYSGSQKVNEVAVFKINSKGKTSFCGSKKENELGLYDMSGNVWEWCWDLYNGEDDSMNNSNTNPYKRIIKGGSWNDIDSECTVYNWNYMEPDDYGYDVGFRICRNK